jgi:hypothetical protein
MGAQDSTAAGSAGRESGGETATDRMVLDSTGMTSPAIELVPAALHYAGKPDTPATARVRRYDRSMRMSRALRTLGVGWALAIAAIFLPVLHFILVPALALGAPLVALQRWGEAAVLIGASGDCPGCGKPQEWTLHPSKLGEPVAHRCESCGRGLTLVTAVATR